MESGFLFLTHPQDGMFVERPENFTAAEARARAFVAEHYPEVKTQDAWSLTGWWLEFDDGRIWFGPLFGFLAAYFTEEILLQVLGPELPMYLVFGAGDGGRPVPFKFDDKEVARTEMTKLARQKVVGLDNKYDGITFVLETEDGPRVAAYAIKLKPDVAV
jgi:hypothetical protein